MISLKKILVSTSLALLGAAPAYAGELVYREAASPWSAEQAVKLPSAMTADFLKGVEKAFGAPAAAGLAEKKEKVSGLIKRFKVCALNAEDLKTADKYLAGNFKAEVRYFGEQGCAAFRGAAADRASLAPQPASLSDLQELVASGAAATYEGSARFFDGASGKGQSRGFVTAPAPLSSGKALFVPAAASKPLSSKIPALSGEVPLPEPAKAGSQAGPGEDRMVHQALAYWGKMRRDNWAAFKNAENGPGRIKALLKAAAGAGFGGILIYSNLEAVETDSARLRQDARLGSGAGAIASDSAKLIFNSMVFILAFAPIPILKVAKGVLAGEGWAIALVAAMCAGTVNHYILPVAD